MALNLRSRQVFINSSPDTPPPVAAIDEEPENTKQINQKSASPSTKAEKDASNQSETDTPKPVLSKGKDPPDLKPWPRNRIVFILVLFRWLNAALTQTYFAPDEYWQSLEVAHNVVFGYPFSHD